MAWGTPHVYVGGELMTAANENAQQANIQGVRDGGIAIASQAALDFLFASNASQVARLAKGAGLQGVRLNAAAAAYEFADWAGRLTFDDTQVGTDADTSEKALVTYTVPANVLAVNGRSLRIVAHGSYVANANTKTVRVRWNGLSGTIGGVIVTGGVGSTRWRVEALVSRIASNSQRLAWNHVALDTVNNVYATADVDYATAAVTDSGAIDLMVTGQNGTAAANDIVLEAAWVEAF
jgi:hypothetical protein